MHDRKFEIYESIGRAPLEWGVYSKRLDASYYLSADYAEVLRSDGNTPIFFSLALDGRVVGMALGALTDTWRRWPSSKLHRGFKWNTHPCVEHNDHAMLNDFVELILSRLRRHRPLHFELNSEDARISPIIAEHHKMHRIERLEFLVDLTGGPTQVLNQMQKRKREKLKAQLRDSIISVTEKNTKDALIRLIEFQDSSRERRRARGEDYSVATKNAAESIFDSYLATGHARLFLASDDQGPVSGILLHTNSTNAYYTMSGCAARGFEINAQTVNVWRAIEALHSDGFTTLNMGGVKAEAADPSNIGHGLYRFKKSFGGVQTECISWQKKTEGLTLDALRALFYY